MAQCGTDTSAVSRGEVRRGVLSMKCFRSDSEHTSGILEIFSRAILLGTHLQICENIVFRDYEFLEIDQALENIAISLSFHTLSILLNYEMYCIVIGCFGEGGGSSPRNF